jgi:hypothetical protein
MNKILHYSGMPHSDVRQAIDTNLNILSHNIRGLTGSLDEFEFFIENFKSRIQIIALTETWLRDPEGFESRRRLLPSMNSYEAYHSVRSSGSGGGILLLVGKELPSKFIRSYTSGDVQLIVVSLTKLRLNICVCYRPPYSENIPGFFDLLETVLSSYPNLIFLGDININLLEITSHPAIFYHNIVTSHGYNFLNKINSSMATRVTSHSATIIDHALTNINLNRFKSVILNQTHPSDHKYMIISLRDIKFPKPFLKSTYIKKDFQAVQNNLHTFPFDSFDEFHLALQHSVEERKILVETETRLTSDKPWFSMSLSKIAKLRDKFYSLKIKYPSNQYFIEKFNNYRNLFRKSIREAKKKYFGAQII